MADIDHIPGEYYSDSELEPLFTRALQLRSDQDDAEYLEACALIDNAYERIIKAILQEPPPFATTQLEREAYMDKIRHRVMHRMFEMGRAWEQLNGGDNPTAFTGFIDGLEMP